MDTDGPPERLRLIYGEVLTNSSPPPLSVLLQSSPFMSSPIPTATTNGNINSAHNNIILNNANKLAALGSQQCQPQSGDINYNNGIRQNLNPHALTFIQQQQQQQLNLGYSHPPPGLAPIMSPGLYSNSNSHGNGGSGGGGMINHPPPGLSQAPLSPHCNAPPGFYYPPTQNPTHLYEIPHHQQQHPHPHQSFGTGAQNNNSNGNSNSALYSRPIMPVQAQPQNQNHQQHHHQQQQQQQQHQFPPHYASPMYLQQQQHVQLPTSQGQGLPLRGNKMAVGESNGNVSSPLGHGPMGGMNMDKYDYELNTRMARLTGSGTSNTTTPNNETIGSGKITANAGPGCLASGLPVGKPMIEPMIENIVGSMSGSTNGTYTHFGPITPGGGIARGPISGGTGGGSASASVVTSTVHLPSRVIGSTSTSFGNEGPGKGHVLAFNSVVSNTMGSNNNNSNSIGSNSNSKPVLLSESSGKIIAAGVSTAKKAAIVSPSFSGNSNNSNSSANLKEKLGIVHPRVIGKESPVHSPAEKPRTVSPKEGGSDSRPQTPGKPSYSEILVKNEPKGGSNVPQQKGALTSHSPLPLTAASIARKNSLQLQSDFREKSPSSSSSSCSSPVTKPKLSMLTGDSTKYTNNYKGKENSNSSSLSSSSKSSTTKSTPNGTPTHNNSSSFSGNNTTNKSSSSRKTSYSGSGGSGNERKILTGSFTNGNNGTSSTNNEKNRENQSQKTTGAGNNKIPGRTTLSSNNSSSNSFQFEFDIEDLDDIHEKMGSGWSTKGQSGAGKRGSASSLNSLNSCNGKNSNSNINSSSSTSSGSTTKTSNSNSASSCNNNMNNATPGTTGTSGNPLTVTNNLTTNSTNTTNANNTSSSSGENKKTGSVLTNSNSSGSNAAPATGKSVRKKEKHSSRKGGRNRMVERARLLTTIWIGHLISALHWLWTLVVNVSTLSCSLAFTLLEDLYCWWKSNAVPSVRIYYRDGVDKIWEYWVRFKSKIPWWGSRGKSSGAHGTGGSGGEAGGEGSSSGGKYGRPRGLNSKDDEILSMMGPERNILLPSNGDEALKRLLSVKGQDPYSILGIRSDSSDETVRRYYKKQAVLVHPDKNVVPGAEEAFKILARAFELVGEPLKRIDYHRQLLEAHEKERVFGEIGNLLEQLRKKMESVSNTIRCTKCNSRHKKNRTDRPLFAARYCAHCRINHAAREGDLWAERKGLFGLSRQYYTCMDSAVWEVNEWASCQKKNLKHLQPDSHNVMYRLVAGAGGVGGGGGNGGGNSGPGGPTGPSQGGQSGKTGNVKGHGPSNSNPNHCHDECNGHGSSTGAGTGGHQHQHYHDNAGGDMNDWDTLLSNLRHGANATVNKMANGHGHSHGSGTCTGCNGGSGNPGSTSTADGNIGAGGNSSSARRRGKVKRSK